MPRVPALKVAVDLLHFPSQAALIRAGPLPEGVPLLLRIAAGNTEAISQALASEGRSLETIREATAFFLEQVLLHADADSYRVLGATPEASYAKLRHNMTLLLQWLHPDLDRRGARSVFAARVTGAWNDLKTPERRLAYDRAQKLALAPRCSLRTHRPVHATSNQFSARRFHTYRRYADLRHSNTPYPGALRRILFSWFGRFAYWK